MQHFHIRVPACMRGLLVIMIMNVIMIVNPILIISNSPHRVKLKEFSYFVIGLSVTPHVTNNLCQFIYGKK
jgi:hypothetical protein